MILKNKYYDILNRIKIEWKFKEYFKNNIKIVKKLKLPNHHKIEEQE